jgi:hypothetical protein
VRGLNYYRIVEISECEYFRINIERARVVECQIETLLCLQGREKVPVQWINPDVDITNECYKNSRVKVPPQ